MAETGPPYQPYVGIDIAADTFTAAWLPAGGTPTAPLTCGLDPISGQLAEHGRVDPAHPEAAGARGGIVNLRCVRLLAGA